MSSLLRANRPAGAKDSRKITKIDPPGHPKSTQERPKSLFGTLFEALGSKKSVEEPVRALLGRLGRSNRPLGATVEATWVDLGSLGRPVGGVRSGHVGAQVPNALRLFRIGILIY